MTPPELLKPPGVAIAISESPDMPMLGLAQEHLDDAMAEVARHLLAAGAHLIYGGDLRENGFTEILFELVARYQRDLEAGQPTALATNFLAWPVHVGMPYDALKQLADSIAGTAELVLLTLDGRTMSLRQREQLTSQQATEEEWAAGLTAMRKAITRRSAARIVLGGHVEKFKDHMPGVAEECLIALRAHQPLFLLGGFGGCAGDIARDLGLVRPSGLIADRAWPGREEFTRFAAEQLNNGLTPAENSTLAGTLHIDQAVPLILSGLLRKKILALTGESTMSREEIPVTNKRSAADVILRLPSREEEIQLSAAHPVPPGAFQSAPGPTIPVNLVPTPTIEYRAWRKALRATVNTSKPTTPTSPALPSVPRRAEGARVLIWKQDPSSAEIGIRKAYLPGPVVTGPRDARIRIEGTAPVSPNMMGDLIGPAPGTEAFDAIHTFAVVRQTLTMYQRARGGQPLPWQWNNAGNTAPLQVFPRAGETMNAFYSRDEQALKFFFFNKPGSPAGSPKIFTCRSLDIVAHETGHAILDALKPSWILNGNPPQTGGLHESFGDLTAIFLMLSQMDQVEAVIAQTKANLHDKTFLSDLAEEFGLALGRPNGLRNADNDFRLSEVGNEVHAISQVFTGGIYDVLADIFDFERNASRRDEARTLYDAAEYLQGLLLRAIIAAPAIAATYADVVNNMLSAAAADGKPVEYRNFIRNRFTLREVVVSPTPLDENHEEGMELAPRFAEPEGTMQDRRGCCGTMQQPEYYDGEEAALQAELDELNLILKKGSGTKEHAASGRRR